MTQEIEVIEGNGHTSGTKPTFTYCSPGARVP
jgi:hypothetical protein